jgi:hypothetical protein
MNHLESFIKISLILLVVFISACSQVNLRTKSAIGNFYDKIDKSDFHKRATYKMSLMENSVVSSASLFNVPQIVQVKIQIPQVDRVLYVRLIENQYLNIKRHLIFGKEYLFDEKENMLYVLIDLPVVYLLKGRLEVFLDILALNSVGAFTNNLQKRIIFNWSPLKVSKETGFQYGQIGTDDSLIDPDTIKDIVSQEYNKCAVNRLTSDYVSFINSVYPQNQSFQIKDNSDFE